MNDRASIRQGLDYVIQALDAVVEASIDPNYRDEVAAEEVRLRQVISRAKLALSFVEEYRSRKAQRAN